MITLKDIQLAIAFYFLCGLLASVIGAYLSYYTQINIQKAQMKRLAKEAPEVEDNRPSKDSRDK
mgnify:FL=1